MTSSSLPSRIFIEPPNTGAPEQMTPSRRPTPEATLARPRDECEQGSGVAMFQLRSQGRQDSAPRQWAPQPFVALKTH